LAVLSELFVLFDGLFFGHDSPGLLNFSVFAKLQTARTTHGYECWNVFFNIMTEFCEMALDNTFRKPPHLCLP